MKTIHIRRAAWPDFLRVVGFNLALALESEGKDLDRVTVGKGVAALFDDPHKGFYLVAEIEGKVVGQLMITTEWSDWRNGWFWWIQSVYVQPEFRRKGAFRALFAEVRETAKKAGDVIGLRLYVERDNLTAQQTYSQMGMGDTGYLVLEMT